MDDLLTTAQAARALGVKPQTIYAYVSRGVLPRSVASDGRTSRFRRADVERLHRRGGRLGAAARPGPIEVVLTSAITEVRATGPRYRGHEVSALVRRRSFEQVAELLWTGQLPSARVWSVRDDVEPIGAEAHRLATAAGASAGDALRIAASLLAAARPLRIDLRPETVVRHGRELLAVYPSALGAPATGALASRLWQALSPLSPTSPRTSALEATLIVLADHEMASSTLGARVAASTRADPITAVQAGLAVVSGPLHGRASVAVHRLLSGATDPRATGRAIADLLAEHGGLPGFGHPLYPDGDPRAAIVLAQVQSLVTPARWSSIEHALDLGRRASGAEPNIDAALGALAVAARMASDAPEAVFAIARTAGWIAHVLEEYGERPLRFRARAAYTG